MRDYVVNGARQYLSCNEKIGPPPKSVWPDQFWQPKLVPLANFGPPSENVNSKQFKVAIGS